MAKAVATGTKLYVQIGSEWVAVGNLTSLPVPGAEKPEVDVTDFDSTAAENLPGIPDNGSLDFSGFYNNEDAGQDQMFDDASDNEAPLRDFRIDFTRLAESFLFSGWVKSFRPMAGGPRDAYTFTGSIRVSGTVTKGVLS